MAGGLDGSASVVGILGLAGRDPSFLEGGAEQTDEHYGAADVRSHSRWIYGL